MLLNALVGLELLTKAGSLYALTPESAAFLVSGKPGYRGGMLRHGSTQLIPHWLKLTEAVRSGKPPISVNQENTGGEFFREFVEDLFAMGYPSAKVLADHLLAQGRRRGRTACSTWRPAPASGASPWPRSRRTSG